MSHRDHIEDLYRGRVEKDEEAQPRPTIDRDGYERKDLHELASLWVRGAEVDWEKLYSEPKPKRVSLPTTPFKRKRYWSDSHNPLPPQKR